MWITIKNQNLSVHGPKPRFQPPGSGTHPAEASAGCAAYPLGLDSERSESFSPGEPWAPLPWGHQPSGPLLRPPPPPTHWVGHGGPRVPWLAISKGQPSPPRSLKMSAIGCQTARQQCHIAVWLAPGCPPPLRRWGPSCPPAMLRGTWHLPFWLA